MKEIIYLVRYKQLDMYYTIPEFLQEFYPDTGDYYKLLLLDDGVVILDDLGNYIMLDLDKFELLITTAMEE